MPTYLVTDKKTGKSYRVTPKASATNQGDWSEGMGPVEKYGTLAAKGVSEIIPGAANALAIGQNKLSSATNGLVPHLDMSSYNAIQPHGTGEQLAEGIPEGLGRLPFYAGAMEAAGASPIIAGAGNVVSKIPMVGGTIAKLLPGMAGFGGASATEDVLRGQPGKAPGSFVRGAITSPIMEGAGQIARLAPEGATLARQGLTAAGMGTVSTAMAPQGEKISQGVIGGGLGAMFPEEAKRPDPLQAIADSKMLPGALAYNLKIPKELTSVAYKYGGDSALQGNKPMGIDEASGRPLYAPDIADQRKRQALAIVKKDLNKRYDAMRSDLAKIKPSGEETVDLSEGIVKIANRNPTLNISESLSKYFSRFIPSEPNTGEFHISPDAAGTETALKLLGLTPNDTKEVSNTISKNTEIGNLEKLHDMRINLDDVAMNSKDFNEKKIAQEASERISGFIGEKYGDYKALSPEWKEMLKIQNVSNELTPERMSNNFYEKKLYNGELDQRAIDTLDRYFQDKLSDLEMDKSAIDKFKLRPLLEKYHFAETFDPKNPSSPNSFRAGAGLSRGASNVAGMVGGSIGGAILGHPVTGAAAGLGYVAATHMMRPSSWKPVIERIRAASGTARNE